MNRRGILYLWAAVAAFGGIGCSAAAVAPKADPTQEQLLAELQEGVQKYRRLWATSRTEEQRRNLCVKMIDEHLIINQAILEHVQGVCKEDFWIATLNNDGSGKAIVNCRREPEKRTKWANWAEGGWFLHLDFGAWQEDKLRGRHRRLTYFYLTNYSPLVVSLESIEARRSAKANPP